MGGDQFSSPMSTPSNVQQQQSQGVLTGNIMASPSAANAMYGASPANSFGGASNTMQNAAGGSIAAPPPLAGSNGSTQPGIYNIRPADTSQPGYFPAGDPFNMQAEGLTTPNGYNYQDSPGYQTYGSDWSNMLNTLQSLPQNFDQYERGQGIPDQYKGLQQPNLSDADRQALNSNIFTVEHTGQGASPGMRQDAARAQIDAMNILNPVGNPNLPSWGLAQNLEQQGAQGADFNTLAGLASPVMSKTFGLDSTSGNNYGKAFATDVKQSDNYNNYHQYLTDIHHDPFSSIMGQLGKAGAYALAGGVENIIGTPFSLAGTVGNAGSWFNNLIPSLESFGTGQGLYENIGKLTSFVNPSGDSKPYYQNAFGSPVQTPSIAEAIVSGIASLGAQPYGNSNAYNGIMPNYGMTTARNA